MKFIIEVSDKKALAVKKLLKGIGATITDITVSDIGNYSQNITPTKEEVIEDVKSVQEKPKVKKRGRAKA